MDQRLPQHFIDELIAATDIVAVVGSRIELKKAGKEYKACSPFTAEKSPSFYVNPAKRMYFCFSSGKNGNALGFLMDHDRMSFMDAIKELADMAGMELPKEAAKPSQHRLQSAVRKAATPSLDFLNERYRAALKSQQSAIDYLKQIGISGVSARNWSIGYAADELRNAPSLRGCIALPVFNRDRQVGGFVSHPLGGNRIESAVAGPEFDPSKDLFGLHQRFQGEPASSIVVVSSCMDVIQLDQFGVRGAVAAVGQSISVAHLRTAFTKNEEITIFQADSRDGRQAAWKLFIEVGPHLTGKRRVSFAFIPEGLSPAALCAKEGAHAIRLHLSQAKSAERFAAEALVLKHRTDGVVGFNASAQKMLRMLPDGLVKQGFSAQAQMASSALLSHEHRPQAA